MHRQQCVVRTNLHDLATVEDIENDNLIANDRVINDVMGLQRQPAHGCQVIESATNERHLLQYAEFIRDQICEAISYLERKCI